MRCPFIFALIFIATIAETSATTSCAQDYAAMLEQHESTVSRWRESQAACAKGASSDTEVENTAALSDAEVLDGVLSQMDDLLPEVKEDNMKNFAVNFSFLEEASAIIMNFDEEARNTLKLLAAKELMADIASDFNTSASIRAMLVPIPTYFMEENYPNITIARNDTATVCFREAVDIADHILVATTDIVVEPYYDRVIMAPICLQAERFDYLVAEMSSEPVTDSRRHLLQGFYQYRAPSRIAPLEAGGNCYDSNFRTGAQSLDDSRDRSSYERSNAGRKLRTTSDLAMPEPCWAYLEDNNNRRHSQEARPFTRSCSRASAVWEG